MRDSNKNILTILSICICIGCQGCHPDAIVNSKTFPTFEGITVTDEMDFFYNNNQFQMICVDVSEDKIVKIYDVGYRKTMIYNFIYVKSQKKAYFMFWGNEDILMEFDPTTGKSRRIGTQSYCNAGAVYLYNMDDKVLNIMDNYGHIEDDFQGATYFYEYETDTITEHPYRIWRNSRVIPIEETDDLYLTYSTILQPDVNDSLYLYNWTKKTETGINLVDFLPQNPSGLTYILPNDILAIVDVRLARKTYLYHIESYIPFKVEQKPFDCIQQYWVSDAVSSDGYIYLIDWSTIIKYDLQNKKINNILEQQNTTDELYDEIEINHFHGSSVYTINKRERNTVIKINLDDFSITKIRK